MIIENQIVIETYDDFLKDKYNISENVSIPALCGLSENAKYDSIDLN